MLQVRMQVVQVNFNLGGKTAVLEPVRDQSNVDVPEEHQVASGKHISGRLTLEYNTTAAIQLFEGGLDKGQQFMMTLLPVEPPPQVDETSNEKEEK